MREHAEWERSLLCRWCGYNLKGLSSRRCPECGTDFDPLRVFADADYITTQRWHGLLNAAYVSFLFVLTTPLLLLGAPFMCVFLAVPPLLSAYATYVTLKGVWWKFSASGVHTLACATPGLRLDYERALKEAVLLYVCAIVIGITLLAVVVW